MNLEEAERAIGIAWMAGLVAAIMALTIIGISLAGFELMPVTPLALVDLAFMFLLYTVKGAWRHCCCSSTTFLASFCCC